MLKKFLFKRLDMFFAFSKFSQQRDIKSFFSCKKSYILTYHLFYQATTSEVFERK